MGDIIDITPYRLRRHEARLESLKALERACLQRRGLTVCTECPRFPFCSIWQESLATVVEGAAYAGQS